VVSYIVRSVDELLRSEFGLEDGLADTTTWGEMAKRQKDLKIPSGVSPDQDFVQILDPATGTGTFLVEVIDVIHRTSTIKWRAQGHGEKKMEALWNEYVPKHLLPRLHAYELKMAPYAIAHLKLGLKLHETGYRFGSDERARIYLTNALEPPHDFSGRLDFAIPALAREAQAVNAIKRTQRFTVVIGNPPYATVSQNMGEHARQSVALYLNDDRGPIDEKSNRNHLQDDYVKFIRLSEVGLNATGLGILGMVTNGSFLDGDWFRGMRYQLSRRFGFIEFLDLHGGVRKHHRGDENVFDIRQNVAVSLMVDSPLRSSRRSGVWYAQLLGSREHKYKRLLTSEAASSAEAAPERANRWAFIPQTATNKDLWANGLPLIELFHQWGYGAKTNRDGLAVAFTESELLTKIGDFDGRELSDSWLEGVYGFGSNYQWTTANARARLRKDGVERSRITPYLFRPFDHRFIYWHPATVFNMRGAKLEVFRQQEPPLGLLFSRSSTRDEPTNFFVTRSIVDCHCLEDANVAPVSAAVSGSSGQLPVFSIDKGERHSNINMQLLASWLAAHEDIGEFGSSEAAAYLYALFHSPGYRSLFSEELKRDRPRVFLARSTSLIRLMVQFGKDLIALHLMEGPKVREFITEYSGPSGPAVQRVGWSDETVWLDAAATKNGQPVRPGTIGFRGVPESVWNFHIGGYQVCEKWLKDRKGRTLSAEDIAHYQKIVVALTETIRLMKEIDEVIDVHGGWPTAFQPATPSVVITG